MGGGGEGVSLILTYCVALLSTNYVERTYHEAVSVVLVFVLFGEANFDVGVVVLLLVFTFMLTDVVNVLAVVVLLLLLM